MYIELPYYFTEKVKLQLLQFFSFLYISLLPFTKGLSISLNKCKKVYWTFRRNFTKLYFNDKEVET